MSKEQANFWYKATEKCIFKGKFLYPNEKIVLTEKVNAEDLPNYIQECEADKEVKKQAAVPNVPKEMQVTAEDIFLKPKKDKGPKKDKEPKSKDEQGDKVNEQNRIV